MKYLANLLLAVLIAFVALYILFFAQENIAGFLEPTSPAERALDYLWKLDEWI